jgi:hypothetical protein
MLTDARPFLSVCHTAAGSEADISANGQAIDKAAKKTKS